MKFKHHLNEQNMAHFILLWLVSVTLGYFTPLAVAHHYPPPSHPTLSHVPIYTVHRLSYNKSAE